MDGDPARVRTLLPDEIIEALHGEPKARDYKVIELDLTTARANERYTFRGNCAALVYMSASGTPVRVRLNDESRDAIPFYVPGAVTRAFDCVYVSHEAAIGVKAVLFLGWDLRT